jgi:hypothetical protein
MKNIKFLKGIVLIFTAFTFTSCDVEPLDSAINIDDFITNESAFYGTYLLTAFNTSIPTDLNNDGVASANQMTETTCFTGSKIILNSDNTFTFTFNEIDIAFNGTNDVLNCAINPEITGTWTLNDNALALTALFEGVNQTLNATIGDNKIVWSENNVEIVATTTSNMPIHLFANVEKVYTKQ